MAEPLPDPRLRRALDALDALKRELRAERIRSAHWKRRAEQVTAQRAAEVQRPEQRPA